jgi:transcriptional regulator with XRE-family HTH domain
MPEFFGIPKDLSIGTPNPARFIMPTVETGKRIRALRIARGLKQKDLARQIGIAAPSLSELETGKSREPSGPVLAALCKALKTNQDWLLTGRGDAGAYTTLDGDHAELHAIWQSLPEVGKSALLATARALRDTYAPHASESNPYPKQRIGRPS